VKIGRKSLRRHGGSVNAATTIRRFVLRYGVGGELVEQSTSTSTTFADEAAAMQNVRLRTTFPVRFRTR